MKNRCLQSNFACKNEFFMRIDKIIEYTKSSKDLISKRKLSADIDGNVFNSLAEIASEYDARLTTLVRYIFDLFLEEYEQYKKSGHQS